MIGTSRSSGPADRPADGSGSGVTGVGASLHDPALIRGLTRQRLSRRNLFRLAGLAGATVLAAACGDGTGPGGRGAAADVAGFWSGRERAGRIDFANWRFYMDVGASGSGHPSLELFTRETGIQVGYHEAIRDNESFFSGVRADLAAGRSIGYDLMVLTNGNVQSRVIELGYLAPLDHRRLPMFAAEAAPSVKDPAYDPGNRFTVAWQSGITGIAYDPTRTGREISRFADLFDPTFAGRVGMFGENEDLPNLALLGIGVPPASSTPDDWRRAAEKLHQQRAAGIVRRYYEQEYIDSLTAGELWLSMAWSGDVYQRLAAGANLKFVVPEEGGLIWTDSMCIPVTAQNPVDAITYMDFVYRPDVAGMLAEDIRYLTPVPAARGHVSPALAGSPLLFPTRAELDRVHRYRVLTAAEETEWNSIFQPVYQR